MYLPYPYRGSTDIAKSKYVSCPKCNGHKEIISFTYFIKEFGPRDVMIPCEYCFGHGIIMNDQNNLEE
jgi:hypothetical protein